MDIYQIEWRKSALRELKRLDRHIVSRIVSTVESLATVPLPSGVPKLRGSQRTFRLRLGDYRVIYELWECRLVVQIVRVRHRKDVYRK